VVILTLNGGSELRRSIEQILSQKIDGPIELVLVDSGSSDGTEHLDRQFPLKMVRIPKSSFRFGAARNLAFASSTGKYVATISQDYVPAGPNWLAELVRPLREGADVSLGAVIPPRDRRPFYWETRRFCYTSEGREFIRRHGGIGFSCTCLATRRDVWEQTGFGDDTPMSEDKVFQKRCFEKGFSNVVHAEAAVGYHGHQYEVRSVFKRCENEGFGWKWVGEHYGFGNLLFDLLSPGAWVKLGLGIVTGKVRSAAELFFPLIRPVAVYRGNRHGSGFRR
jgi:rhamnosyltransferase